MALRLQHLAGGAILSAALAASGNVSAQDVIKIGIPVGLSGANSVVAPSVVQSAELAVPRSPQNHDGQIRRDSEIFGAGRCEGTSPNEWPN